MGGLGKTALAQRVYEAVCRQFEASYFLRNIREDSERHGIACPQRKLLFNLGVVEAKDECFDGALAITRVLHKKKVLIILDDESHKSQLENLAGSEQWFGRGSKIIITTRDQSLLSVYRQFEIYEVGALNPDESLELFCQRAFKNNMPKEDYLHLSQEVIEYARGVPLVLTVLGSNLCNRSQIVWRGILEQYRQRLPEEILSVLRISFDGLESDWKMIFLDIACFLNGRTKFEVMKILETCYALPVRYVFCHRT
ncbi:hypothetical protein K1719_030016 [Acacia pycnantha]|nr:hypothetical protein K1719_030016 [Acacia pycnantha]